VIVRGPWLLRAVLGAAGAGLLVLSLLGFFAERGLGFELLAHLRVQWLAAAALLTLLSVFSGSRWATLMTATALAANAGAVYGAMAAAEGPRAAQRGAPVVTIVWANLQAQPQALEWVAALARAERADIVALTELTAGGANAAARALDGFECRTPVTGVVDRRTTLILARTCEGAGESGLPSPSSAVWLESEGLRVVAAHPAPPLSENGRAMRDLAIEAAVDLRSLSGPTLMIGDFNATPYAKAFDGLTLAALSRARCGGPFVSTWGTANPLMGLHIDHVFVSAGVRLLRCRVGPWSRSDHAPLVVRVQIAAP